MHHSNDEEFLLPEPTRKFPKGDLPLPLEHPNFEPPYIPKTSGHHNLLPLVNRSNLAAIFNLLFAPKVIQTIADAINENARLKRSKEIRDPELQLYQRRGKDVNPTGILAYSGVCLWMGCHNKDRREAYWNTNEEL
jgi:hypothetical protein